MAHPGKRETIHLAFVHRFRCSFCHVEAGQFCRDKQGNIMRQSMHHARLLPATERLLMGGRNPFSRPFR